MVQTFFDTENNNAKRKQNFVTFQIAENLTEEIESLICKLSIEKKKLVLKRIYLLQDPNLSEKKSYESWKLLPTTATLKFYLKRAFRQLRIWVTGDKAQLDEHDSNIYGWMLKTINLFPEQSMSASRQRSRWSNIVQLQIYLIGFLYD